MSRAVEFRIPPAHDDPSAHQKPQSSPVAAGMAPSDDAQTTSTTSSAIKPSNGFGSGLGGSGSSGPPPAQTTPSMGSRHHSTGSLRGIESLPFAQSGSFGRSVSNYDSTTATGTRSMINGVHVTTFVVQIATIVVLCVLGAVTAWVGATLLDDASERSAQRTVLTESVPALANVTAIDTALAHAALAIAAVGVNAQQFASIDLISPSLSLATADTFPESLLTVMPAVLSELEQRYGCDGCVGSPDRIVFVGRPAVSAPRLPQGASTTNTTLVLRPLPTDTRTAAKSAVLYHYTLGRAGNSVLARWDVYTREVGTAWYLASRNFVDPSINNTTGDIAMDGDPCGWVDKVNAGALHQSYAAACGAPQSTMSYFVALPRATVSSITTYAFFAVAQRDDTRQRGFYATHFLPTAACTSIGAGPPVAALEAFCATPSAWVAPSTSHLLVHPNTGAAFLFRAVAAFDTDRGVAVHVGVFYDANEALIVPHTASTDAFTAFGVIALCLGVVGAVVAGWWSQHLHRELDLSLIDVILQGALEDEYNYATDAVPANSMLVAMNLIIQSLNTFRYVLAESQRFVQKQATIAKEEDFIRRKSVALNRLIALDGMKKVEDFDSTDSGEGEEELPREDRRSTSNPFVADDGFEDAAPFSVTTTAPSQGDLRQRLGSNASSVLPMPVFNDDQRKRTQSIAALGHSMGITLLTPNSPLGEPSKRLSTSSHLLSCRKVTILTAYVHGIAQLPSLVDAEAMSRAYLNLFMELIESHKGTVVSVAANSIKAVWNAFGSVSQHETKAANCAAAMLHVLEAEGVLVDDYPCPPTVSVVSGYVYCGTVGTGPHRQSVVSGKCMEDSIGLHALQLAMDCPIVLTNKIAHKAPASVQVLAVDIISYDDGAMEPLQVSSVREPAFNQQLVDKMQQAFVLLMCGDAAAAANTYSEIIQQIPNVHEQIQVRRLKTLCQRLVSRKWQGEYFRTPPGWEIYGGELPAESLFMSLNVEGEEGGGSPVDVNRPTAVRFAEEPNGDPLPSHGAAMARFSINSTGSRLSRTSTGGGTQRNKFKYRSEKRKSQFADDKLREDLKNLSKNRGASASGAPHEDEANPKSLLIDAVDEVTTSRPTSHNSGLLGGSQHAADPRGSRKVSALSRNQAEAGSFKELGDGVIEFTDHRHMQFRISEKVLGKGAFGEVFLGMSEAGALVAIKSIDLPKMEDEVDTSKMTEIQKRRLKRKNMSAGTTSNQIDEIVHEVAVLSRLRHDNIVGYLTSTIVGKRLLTVMEYLSGGSLRGVLDTFNNALPFAQAKRYLRQTLLGLKFLHSENVIHRDIKPHNVLLLIDGSCKLTDFGTAKMSQLQSGSNVQGTPQYMAPEACLGSAEKASDIWSFGIMAYEMMTGRMPWTAEDVAIPLRLIYRIGHEEDLVPTFTPAYGGDSPTAATHMLPPDALDMLKLCCQRDPSQRPTAAALLDMPFFRLESTMVGMRSGMPATTHPFGNPEKR